MTSAYSKRCQHFLPEPTLSRLFNNCIKLYWYWISFPWNMKGESNWHPPTPKKTTKKQTALQMPILIRVNMAYSTHGHFSYICGVLRDLVPFLKFKEREKHPWRSVSFSKVRGWSLQMVPNRATRHILEASSRRPNDFSLIGRKPNEIQFKWKRLTV